MGKPTVVDRGRRVDCTVWMAFIEDPETLLDKAKVDLSQIEELQLSIKGIQERHRKRNLMLMCTSNNPLTAAVASEVNSLLTKCKNRFKTAKPNLWTEELHSRPFPKMMCIIDGAKGVWEQNQPQGRDAKKEDTSHRKIPRFIYANKNEEIIQKVVLECRRQGME